MGAVYKAEDTKLGRDVAIKVLPPAFVESEERIARFDREARALAALNHQHIATIHGVENVSGTRFIVMELVAGETLADFISRGPVPVDEALAIARQIASALDAAHEKGVIHRDLKPGNIMINNEGRVKVLDFGLARSLGQDSIDTEFLNSPTVPQVGTHTGVILGTAGYMSPEQARGKKVDRRADVWAFGVVLFEMLTGRRLFTGESVSDALAAILMQQPDWAALPQSTPPNIRRLLRRCLAKSPAVRMRDFGDIILELDEIETTPATVAGRSHRRAYTVAPWIVTALAIAAAAFAFWRSRQPEPGPLTKMIVSTQIENAWNITPAISPDGRRIAYSASGSLWIRNLDELEPRRIPLSGVRQPVLFWSPDSAWLAFVSDARLWKIAPGGSAPVPLAPLPSVEGGAPLIFHSGAWGADNRIVLSRYKGGLYELSARGGAPTEFLPADANLVDFHNLSFLPDGRTLIAIPHHMDNRATVEVIRGTTRQRIFNLNHGVLRGVAYSPEGYLLVGMEGIDAGVWAVRFSADKLTVAGKPFLVAPLAGACSAANNGSLAYVANVDYTPRQLVRIDRSGKITTIGQPIDGLASLIVAHDERTVALTARDSENRKNVSLLDVASGSLRQVTHGDFEDRAMMFSRDGRRLLVHRDLDGAWSGKGYGLWDIPIDGSGAPRYLARAFFGQFTPDEKNIVYLTVVPRDTSNIATVPADGSAAPVEIIKSPYPKWSSALSPDGRFIAYESIESGTREIFLASYPGGDGKRQLSRGGAAAAVWSRDGRTLYYVSSNRLFSMPVFTTGQPAEIFNATPAGVSLSAGYDVLGDGSVIAAQDLPADKRQVVLVQNWTREFQRDP